MAGVATTSRNTGPVIRPVIPDHVLRPTRPMGRPILRPKSLYWSDFTDGLRPWVGRGPPLHDFGRLI